MSNHLEHLERPSCPPSARNDFPTKYRTFFDKAGGTVRGYPPTGGILLLPFDVVVAHHLDLPRQTPSLRAQNMADEDIFCARMRLLGAKWWRSEDKSVRKLIGLDEATEEDQKEIAVGWPNSGHGVWVLRIQNTDARPHDYGKLARCITMDERCAVLEAWGAIFYDASNLGQENPRPRWMGPPWNEVTTDASLLLSFEGEEKSVYLDVTNTDVNALNAEIPELGDYQGCKDYLDPSSNRLLSIDALLPPSAYPSEYNAQVTSWIQDLSPSTTLTTTPPPVQTPPPPEVGDICGD